MTNPCPVCSTKIEENETLPASGANSDFFSCSLCGNFILSRTLLSVLPGKLQTEKDAGAKISHAIRQMQKNNQCWDVGDFCFLIAEYSWQSCLRCFCWKHDICSHYFSFGSMCVQTGNWEISRLFLTGSLGAGLEKFETQDGMLWDEVFREAETVIYAVRELDN